MKRVWWVARIAALVAASYCIFTPGRANVRADGGSRSRLAGGGDEAAKAVASKAASFHASQPLSVGSGVLSRPIKLNA